MSLEVLVQNPVTAWFIANPQVIAFYALVILVIYKYRAKFDWPSRFIGLYRTKIGLKLMERLGRHKKFFKAFGYTGVVFGYTGMLFIIVMLCKGLYDLLFVPGAPPVISPVIPGVPIPGMGITVPLITGWLALFTVIVVHEFCHGVVARAHDIPVKSSGLMVFGPLGGAFVEPEEKQLVKAQKSTQLSIFGAGPFSNVILSIVVLLLTLFMINPLLTSFIGTNGVTFDTVTPGMPADLAGVTTGTVYDTVNGERVGTPPEFLDALKDLAPGDKVILESSTTGERHEITATSRADDETRGVIGVNLGNNLAKPSLSWLFTILLWFFQLFQWTFLLSLGIGLANLLPLGPVDGGRMLQVATRHFFGAKKGDKVWRKVSMAVITLIIILLFTPLFKALF